MRLLRFFAVLLAIVAANATAEVDTQAFVPESGFYWNQNQSGRGYAIEIQDRTLFMTAYTYTEEGNPTNRDPLWFSALGTAFRDTSSGAVTYRFGSNLLVSREGQCLGCPFVAPITSDTGRPIQITFTSAATATMVIDGETIELVRFWYTDSINDPIFALFGQWMIVTDFTDVDASILPFDGDLLEIAFEGVQNGERTAEGFRGGTAIAVAAAFDAGSQNYVIVVGERQDEFLAYYFPVINFGTDRFIGLAERFTPGSSLTGLGFPAQGYRISDRTHAEQVLGAKRVKAASPGREPAPARPRSRTGKHLAPSIDLESLNRTVRKLEKQLQIALE